MSDADVLQGLRDFSDEALRYGITFIQDMSLLPARLREATGRRDAVLFHASGDWAAPAILDAMEAVAPRRTSRASAPWNWRAW